MILKTDGRGRVRTPVERREALLAEFERSGLPASRFSALVGVRYQTFATWVQRQRQERARAGCGRGGKGHGKAKAGAVRLVEVALQPPGARAQTQALRVLLPGGAMLEVVDAGQAALAAALLKAFA